MTAASASEPTQTTVSVDEFKATLGYFASGVTVVTARDDSDHEEDVAMTATAFMSVSLEPTLVLLSVGEGSRMYDLLEHQDEWAASVLHESQAHVSSRFAIRGRVSDRLLFEDLARHRGPATGALILDDALAALECRTVQRVAAGDHLLLVAQVLTVEQLRTEGRPLLHYLGQYRTLRDRSAGRR